MKIAIEAQRIFRANKHGMDFVVLETIRELQKIDHTNEYYIIVKPGDDRCIEDSINFRVIELACPSYPLWEQLALPRLIRKIQPDILHCTSNTAPLWCNCAMVLTLHDIIYLEKRNSRSKSLYQEFGFHYRKYIVPRILKKCKKIISVSNYECKRIAQHLNISNDRLAAIYNGYSQYFKPQEINFSIVNKYINQKDFLFFLGNTDPKKNTPRLLKAYSIYINESTIKRPLLIADLSENHIDKILKEENIEHIKPYIFISGYIPNTDLPMIYNAAFALLYPSLRESFGIPMLESMACGTPIIAGNISAMPEIAGQGAILVDPYNSENIATSIIHLENDLTLYHKQVKYGLERVKSFSWNSAAHQLLTIYNQNC